MQSIAEDLQIKLTVTSDEHPELHRVLVAINEPRRRTRRLKDLAATGLLFERSGALPAAPPQAAQHVGEQALDALDDAVSAALWDEKAG